MSLAESVTEPTSDFAGASAAALARPVLRPKARRAGTIRPLPSLLPAEPWETIALMDGRFRLAGADVAIEGTSPFAMPAPSERFAIALHGFSWLRHLSAEPGAAGPSQASRAIAARHYVETWLDLRHRTPRLALRPAIAARRLLSWLAALPLLAAEPGLAVRLDRAMKAHRTLLAASAPLMARHADRLLVRVALASHATCRGSDKAVASAAGRLDAELVAQILPDGGHISRDPAVLAALLLDLLPLRDAMLERGLTPSQALCRAIDRMMPMLGFFRHGDGAFASLGGASPLAPQALAALGAREEAGGAAVRGAVHSGYQRLEGGTAVLIADAGEMPAPATMPAAHAGALAFEFSDGPQRIVVNCGVPHDMAPAWREAARTTAAHSTLTLADRPSAPLDGPAWMPVRLRRAPRIGVSVSRGQTANGERLDMRHAGYADAFGLVHTRTVALMADGSALLGCDSLVADEDSEDAAETEMALRFHLHPRVTVGRAERGLRLLMPDGKAWTFHADRPVRVEESVCVTPDRGLRPTRQIVIAGPATAGTRVRWKFARG